MVYPQIFTRQFNQSVGYGHCRLYFYTFVCPRLLTYPRQGLPSYIPLPFNGAFFSIWQKVAVIMMFLMYCLFTAAA